MSTRREISAQLDLGAIFKLAQVARVRCSPGLTPQELRVLTFTLAPPPARDFDDGDASVPALAPPSRIRPYVIAKAPAWAAVCCLVLGADGADFARGGPSEPHLACRR
jgi:hypothetical protein